jgi:acetylornithine/N-succinyldiaminopimelate aminotransferase
LPDICEKARGEGLLWGLVLRPGFVARDLLERVHDAGLLIIPAGERVLRFAPPLVVTIAELEEGIRIVRSVLAALSTGAA